MLPENRVPTPPGEVLLEDLLVPLGIPQVALAAHLGLSVQRIHEIVRDKRGVTSDTAWRLAQAFETKPSFWLNLQALHDLGKSRPAGKVRSLLKRAS